MRNEIGAALGPAGMHDESACDVIERAHHGHFLGLTRRRNAQVGAAFSPRTRQIRMRQRLALVAIEENDIAGLGLGLAQLKPEPNALDLSRDLPPLQRVPRPPPPDVPTNQVVLAQSARTEKHKMFFICSHLRAKVRRWHGKKRDAQARTNMSPMIAAGGVARFPTQPAVSSPSAANISTMAGAAWSTLSPSRRRCARKSPRRSSRRTTRPTSPSTARSTPIAGASTAASTAMRARATPIGVIRRGSISRRSSRRR